MKIKKSKPYIHDHGKGVAKSRLRSSLFRYGVAKYRGHIFTRENGFTHNGIRVTSIKDFTSLVDSALDHHENKEE